MTTYPPPTERTERIRIARGSRRGQEPSTLARRIVGAVISFLLPPGSGQLTIGRGRRLLFFFPLALLALLSVPLLGRFGLFLLLLTWILAAIDMFLCHPRRPLPRWGPIVVGWIALFLLGQVTFRTVRASYLENFSITSASMAPSLLIGDRILASKAAYGLTLPFFSRPLFSYRMPSRGHLVVFRSPKNPEQSFVKRVVGLPGERVAVRQGVLFVNGVTTRLRALPAEACQGSGEDNPSGAGSLRCHEERIGDSVVAVVSDPDAGRTDFPQGGGNGEIIPEGQLFLLGDNRDNSLDSRHIGPISRTDLIGRLSLVAWSSSSRSGPRWARTGKPIR